MPPPNSPAVSPGISARIALPAEDEDVATLRRALVAKLAYAVGKDPITASNHDWFLAAALTVRDKLPFIQDAFVRDVNGRRITGTDSPEEVDVPALEARLLADAQKVMGAGKVKILTICTLQMAALKAKGPPARAPAETGPGAATEKSRCSN